jgi:hypothetical protein
METVDLSKQPLRLLKKMCKYHRKLRKHQMHREAFRSLYAVIKRKQDAYFEKQAKIAESRLQKFLSATIGSR